MLYVVIGTVSRGGLIALLVGVVVCLWNYGFAQRRRTALVVLGFVAFGLLGAASQPKYRERLTASIFAPSTSATGEAASASGSAQSRKRLFLRALDVTIHHPIFGIGPGNFLAYSGGQYDDWHVSHDTYTQLSAEAGVPAFLFFVIAVGAALRHLRQVQRRESTSREVRLLAGALRASLFSYVASAAFADTAYLFYPYFLIVISGVLWQLQIDGAKKERLHQPRKE